MKKLVFFLLVFSLVQVQSQQANFECKEGDDVWFHLYDSLQHSTFKKIDFEMRLHLGTTGMSTINSSDFILRHFKNDTWSAYYFEDLKNMPAEKAALKNIFRQGKLSEVTSDQLSVLWDSLVANNILTMEVPSKKRLTDIINKDNPNLSIDFNIADDAYWTIELVKNNCKRSFRWSAGTASMSNFKDVTEFRNLNAIVRFINSYTNNKGS